MKRTTIFCIITVLYVALVAVLCFANLKTAPDAPRTLFGIESDKVVHFLMFLPFPALAFLSFRTRNMSIGATVGLIVLIFAVGCLIAWGTEYVQGMLPYRTKDQNDMKADMLGLTITSVITFIISAIAHVRSKA